MAHYRHSYIVRSIHPNIFFRTITRGLVSQAGAAVAAVDAVMEGRQRNAFCCVRPPVRRHSYRRHLGCILLEITAIWVAFFSRSQAQDSSQMHSSQMPSSRCQAISLLTGPPRGSLRAAGRRGVVRLLPLQQRRRRRPPRPHTGALHRPFIQSGTCSRKQPGRLKATRSKS